MRAGGRTWPSQLKLRGREQRQTQASRRQSIWRVDLNAYRKDRRLQELVFEMARDLTRDYTNQPTCEAPPHVLFPQFLRIVERFLNHKVRPAPPAELLDVFLSPYYGWAIERLASAVLPDTNQGEAPELPHYEANRE